MRALLDPAIPASHAPLANANVQEFVDFVLALHSDLRAGRVELLSPAELFAWLADLGLYPVKSVYETLLQNAQVSEVSAVDLARLVLTLVERSVKIEDEVVEHSFHAATSNATEALKPACPCHPGIEDLTDKALNYVAAYFVEGSNFAKPSFVAGVRSSGPEVQISFTQEVDALLFVDEFEGFDIQVTGKLSVASALEDFLAECSAEELLIAGPGWDPVNAIRAAAIQMGRSGGLAIGAMKCNAQFLADLRREEMRAPTMVRKILRACAETLTGSAMTATHALRIGKGASESQVRHGKSAAWRRDVDDEWHLHYWQHPTGLVEFARLVPHNEFSILPPAG